MDDNFSLLQQLQQLQIKQLIVTLGLKILGAIFVLIVGLWLARIFRKLIQRLMEKSRVETTLVTFIGNLSYAALITVVILATLGQLGIETASLIALLGAAGLAVGLALQGSLSNFAAGILMIIFRPFRVNDLIEGAGVFGFVQEIQIFTTTLKTLDNKTVIIPNAKLAGDNIINYSATPYRRIDLVFGVAYEEDIDKVKQIIADVLAKDERILKEPAPIIGVLELADNSVNFAVRPWVRPYDYWDVYFAVNESIKKRFDAEEISIPFPQRDVYVYEKKNLIQTFKTDFN